MLKFIRGQKHKAWLIGEVVKGKGKARVESVFESVQQARKEFESGKLRSAFPSNIMRKLCVNS